MSGLVDETNERDVRWWRRALAALAILNGLLAVVSLPSLIAYGETTQYGLVALLAWGWRSSIRHRPR